MPKEKENFSTEEKLKKMIIPKEEEPYKIPNNWVWTRLENIGIFGSGGTPSRKNKNFYLNGNIPWLKTGDLNNGIVTDTEECITEEALKKSSAKIFKKNSIGIAMYGATIGKIGIFGKNMATNQACAVIKCFNEIENKFLFYFLKSVKKELINKAKGGAQPNISQEILKNFLFPLPPLEEQKRIVEKLDFFFEKTQKIKKIIEEVKEKSISKKENILSKAFKGELTEKWRSENKTSSAEELLYKINEEKLKLWEEECKRAEKEGRKKPSKTQIKNISEMLANEDEIPYAIPNNWVWTRLGEIVTINPSKKLLNFDENEFFSFVPMKSISEKTGKLEKIECEKYSKLKKGYTQFIDEDILFAKITPCMENGKCAIAKNLKNNIGYGTTEFHILRCSKGIINKLLHKFLRQRNFRKKAQYNMTGSVGFRRVPANFLENFLFPLPPLEEQKEIVRIIDKFFEDENEISELISLENKIEILEKTILDKAFRGELGTGNIDDVPAVELLKNILETNK